MSESVKTGAVIKVKTNTQIFVIDKILSNQSGFLTPPG